MNERRELLLHTENQPNTNLKPPTFLQRLKDLKPEDKLLGTLLTLAEVSALGMTAVGFTNERPVLMVAGPILVAYGAMVSAMFISSRISR